MAKKKEAKSKERALTTAERALVVCGAVYRSFSDLCVWHELTTCAEENEARLTENLVQLERDIKSKNASS